MLTVTVTVSIVIMMIMMMTSWLTVNGAPDTTRHRDDGQTVALVRVRASCHRYSHDDGDVT
jgi:hypothetical protein